MKELFPELYGDNAPQIAIVEQVREVASWEACVSAGMQSRDERDDAVWRLGAIVTIVGRAYSNDKDMSGQVLKRFSGDIGVEVTTLMKYKRQFVSAFDLCGMSIEDLTIENIPARPYPEVSWSHLALVADLPTEDKVKFLEESINNNLTAKQLKERLAVERPTEKNNALVDAKALSEIEMVEKAFVRIDHEEKVIWMRREFSGYEMRLL